MRVALILGFSVVLAAPALARTVLPAVPAAAQTSSAPPASSVSPAVLNPSDVTLYRELFSAERQGNLSKIRKLLDEISDPTLEGYAEAQRLIAGRQVTRAELIAWLAKYRDLAVADRIYRLAVDRSTRRIRRHHKTIRVALVTDIPAPASVPRRTGGYEDQELPEPTPQGHAGRAVFGQILADIKHGQPARAQTLLQAIRSDATQEDVAILSHRIAASYLAEGMNREAFALAAGVPNSDPAPQLEWDAGFAAYRMGRWRDAATHLEKLAGNGGVQAKLRARAGFWAARADLQAGRPEPVIPLLKAAAREEPSFYGLIAEDMLGINTGTGFTDPVLSQADFHALMAEPAARRAVALWQVGETAHVGNELNRAFVYNNEALDPAMAALARDLGVTNVELRASEASAARGILLTGLFPVPPYEPDGGYHIDKALVLAFARLESRFENGSTSSAGAQGIMQLMPKTADLIAGPGAAQELDDPSYSMSLGQRYISLLLDHLGGNLLELGGAYNAGPGAAERWLETKAGKNDPLLFLESIPIAETRSYVRRLMEYQWMYRRRFGEEAKSLDEIARGEWPSYQPALPPVPAPPPPAPSQASSTPPADATTF
ncbi:MAG: lytic transglycosylase domain-containing protein [Rhizomicrobium sp.]